MRPMESKELMKISLHKRVTVHDEEIRKVSKVPSGELDSTSGPERIRFFRVFNRHIPVMAVAEFVFNPVCKIARTHHQAVNSLVAQLPNQQFKEGLVSYRRKRLGRGWYHRTQAGSQAANQQNSFRLPRGLRTACVIVSAFGGGHVSVW